MTTVCVSGWHIFFWTISVAQFGVGLNALMEKEWLKAGIFATIGLPFLIAWAVVP